MKRIFINTVLKRILTQSAYHGILSLPGDSGELRKMLAFLAATFAI